MLKKPGTWPVVLLVLAALGGPPAAGQVRRQVNLATPGGLRNVGSSGASSSFRAYSYGLGSLESPTVVSSGNPLRSSIESRAVYTVPRVGDLGATMGGASILKPPSAGGRVYSPMASRMTDLAGVPSSGGERPSAFQRAASSFLSTVGAVETTPVPQEAMSITSLATFGSDRFSTYMTDGEKAFKAGDYDVALDRFEMANNLEPKNPESLLSLAHSSFAMSMNSYFRSAYYLTRAIKYFPELPVAPLKPAAIFGSPEAYAERLGRLEKHLATDSLDDASQFVLAYFRWFDGDTRGAVAALAKAKARRTKGEIAEAADAFWDGMKATGRVSGSLNAPVFADQPAPATTSQPATPPAPMDQPTS